VLAGDKYRGEEAYSDLRFARLVVQAHEYATRTRCRGKSMPTSAAYTIGDATHQGIVVISPKVVAAAEAVVSVMG
jgi:hypothetical protein